MKEWDEISEGGCKVWEGKGKEIRVGEGRKGGMGGVLSRCPKAS